MFRWSRRAQWRIARAPPSKAESLRSAARSRPGAPCRRHRSPAGRAPGSRTGPRSHPAPAPRETAPEACLEHAAANGAERYVFLGDYVGYGADPGFAVDTVSHYVARGAIALLGNHDAAVLSTGPAGMNEAAAAAVEWTRGQLTPVQ